MRRWFQEFSRRLKLETYCLYLACRDPRVSWCAKLLAAVVVGYAFSPIDLIPDFIPILGYLDDVVLVPLGVWIVLKMIPSHIIAEHREQAAAHLAVKPPSNWVAGGVIIGIWVMALIAAVMRWLPID